MYNTNDQDIIVYCCQRPAVDNASPSDEVKKIVAQIGEKYPTTKDSSIQEILDAVTTEFMWNTSFSEQITTCQKHTQGYKRIIKLQHDFEIHIFSFSDAPDCAVVLGKSRLIGGINTLRIRKTNVSGLVYCIVELLNMYKTCI